MAAAAKNVTDVPNDADSARRRLHSARKFSAYNARPMTVHVNGASVAVYAAIHCTSEVFRLDEHLGGHALLNLMSPNLSPRHFWKTGDWQGEQALGELSFLPPGTTFSSRTAPCENHVMTLSLAGDLLACARQEIGGAHSLRPCPNLHNPKMRALLELLSQELRQPGLASDLYVSSLLMAIAVELTRHFSGAEEKSQDHWSDAARVRRVIDFIAAHLEQNLSVDLIAKECGMSPRHLSRVFRAAMGTSLWHYVSARRIELAKALLASPHARVKDVSRRCGFDNPTSFATAFRNGTGVAPTEFLRRELASPEHTPANPDIGVGNTDIRRAAN